MTVPANQPQYMIPKKCLLWRGGVAAIRSAALVSPDTLSSHLIWFAPRFLRVLFSLPLYSAMCSVCPFEPL